MSIVKTVFIVVPPIAYITQYESVIEPVYLSVLQVYKILVTGLQGDTWVIFRRYADFSRLNDKVSDCRRHHGPLIVLVILNSVDV